MSSQQQQQQQNRPIILSVYSKIISSVRCTNTVQCVWNTIRSFIKCIITASCNINHISLYSSKYGSLSWKHRLVPMLFAIYAGCSHRNDVCDKWSAITLNKTNWKHNIRYRCTAQHSTHTAIPRLRGFRSNSRWMKCRAQIKFQISKL